MRLTLNKVLFGAIIMCIAGGILLDYAIHATGIILVVLGIFTLAVGPMWVHVKD